MRSPLFLTSSMKHVRRLSDISRLALPLAVVAGTALPQGAVVAQVVEPVPVFDNSLSGDGRSSDPFSGGGDGQASTLLDMFHRANFGTIPSMPDFQRDQQERIGDEATNFRNRQLELLRQQPQAQPASPPPVAPSNES